MRFLEMKDITKTYSGASAPCIEGMDFEMDQGEIIVILGPSGCGKTTTLKLIAGLEKQDSGTISLDDEIVDKVPPNKRPIAMVFQKPLLFKNMTVEKNVNYAPRVKQTMSKEEIAAEVDSLLKLVELEGYNDRKVTQLSGGQEQRVSLARALMTKPKLLLLDEPFSALDAELRVTMRSSVRKICKDLQQSVVFVTHDQQEAVAMADRIALMMNGRMVQYGPPDEFYTRPKTKGAATFFGWKNLIPAHRDGDHAVCDMGIRIRTECDGDVLICIRPEAATISESGIYNGTVRSAKYMGTKSEYIVDVNGIELSIDVNSRYMFVEGDTIRFDLDENMIWAVSDEKDAVPELKEEKKLKLSERLRSRSVKETS
jgi:ABC-type spermidine/putrescine transport systems, ATPase components